MPCTLLSILFAILTVQAITNTVNAIIVYASNIHNGNANRNLHDTTGATGRMNNNINANIDTNITATVNLDIHIVGDNNGNHDTHTNNDQHKNANVVDDTDNVDPTRNNDEENTDHPGHNGEENNHHKLNTSKNAKTTS